MRSARTNELYKVKNVKLQNSDQAKSALCDKCINCQQGPSISRKNDGDNAYRHDDKNNYLDGNVQYNRGVVDGGSYSAHGYGVVQNLPSSCVHCSQNVYSSQGPLGQGSGFIGGLVSPCQTFTIGSVPMVQYHHPFGTGYPIQYQGHNTLPHCGKYDTIYRKRLR